MNRHTKSLMKPISERLRDTKEDVRRTLDVPKFELGNLFLELQKAFFRKT